MNSELSHDDSTINIVLDIIITIIIIISCRVIRNTAGESHGKIRWEPCHWLHEAWKTMLTTSWRDDSHLSTSPTWYSRGQNLKTRDSILKAFKHMAIEEIKICSTSDSLTG